MIRCDTWHADFFRFTVTGQGAQHFLSGAARRGIRLERLRCEADGYSGRAAGADRTALQALAAQGGWQFAVAERRGPGRMIERALARPGLPCGAVLFLVMLQFLSGFVWSMDFGELDDVQAAGLRELLAESRVWEGCYLTGEKLAQAQRQASRQSEEYGWISLNFTGGCLFVESTASQYRAVREQASADALTAKAGGEILSVQVESGFCLVQPGQYVEEGQRLASAVKEDRNGSPVWQAASGAVVARVSKVYAARQPLQREEILLTGSHTVKKTLYLLGRTYAGEGRDGAGRLRREWIPLRLGRLALPGCILQETWWEEAPQPLTYTAEAAQSLAQRACRLQLLTEFPDAEIEACRYEKTEEAGTACCTATYVFLADIAQAAAELPAEQSPEKDSGT